MIVNVCNFKDRSIEIVVDVFNGMDVVFLKIVVIDFFVGVLVVDNIDEFEVGEVVDLGDMDIFEGVCFMKFYFYVIGVDDCDGEICEGFVVIVMVIDGFVNVDLGI